MVKCTSVEFSYAANEAVCGCGLYDAKFVIELLKIEHLCLFSFVQLLWLEGGLCETSVIRLVSTKENALKIIHF